MDVSTNLDDFSIGIGFGATHCVFGAFVKSQLEMVSYQNTVELCLPRCISDTKKILDGENTNEVNTKFLEKTINIKQAIGRQWSDKTLQNYIQSHSCPLQIVDISGTPKIQLGTNLYSPQEIVASLFSESCRNFYTHLKIPANSRKKAVITVPCFFTYRQRRAIIEAVELGGLQVLSLLNETTAAAIACAYAHRPMKEETVILYNFGRSKFEVSIAKINASQISILGSESDTSLGGQNIDLKIAEYCIQEFQRTHHVDLCQSKQSLARLSEACKVAKEELSLFSSVIIHVGTVHGDTDLRMTITRDEFEKLVKPILIKTLELINKLIKSVTEIKAKSDIDYIVMVGGSTKIPLIKKLLQENFLGKPVNHASFDPQETAAHGAAVHAAICTGNNHGLGSFEIHDITAASYGVETRGDRFSRIIPKGTRLPCEQKFFRTVFDREKKSSIKVFQGENGKSSHNKNVGEFVLAMPTSPELAGFVNVEVTMKIDSSGILSLTAVHQGTDVVVHDLDKRMQLTYIDESIA